MKVIEPKREIDGSPWEQAEGERIRYPIDWTNITGTPSNPVITLTDSSGEDKTSECLTTDNTTVSDQIVLTPFVIGLSGGETYKLVCQVLIAGDTLSAYGFIAGTD